MAIWEYFVLFFSVILGGILGFYFDKNNPKILQRILSFSGAYILGICVLHMMPSIFTGVVENVGLYILLGFFIQLVLEQFSGGVEHGHIHPSKERSAKFAFTVMLGLCLHAFLEGMPLSTFDYIQHAHAHQHDHGHHLLWGIILHKAPAAFALVLLMKMSGFKRNVIISLVLVFALMSPLGAASTSYLANNELFDVKNITIVTAIVVGSFLHIATTILFEVDKSGHHHISLSKILAIALGLVMAVLTEMI